MNISTRLKSSQLITLAECVRRIHVTYTRKPSEGDFSRVVCGYIAGKYKEPSREFSQQYTTSSGKKLNGRIDFLLGTESNGTFIELAIIRDGEKWVFKPKLANDLWKLERAGGPQAKRAQLLIDLRDHPYIKGFFADQLSEVLEYNSREIQKTWCQHYLLWRRLVI